MDDARKMVANGAPEAPVPDVSLPVVLTYSTVVVVPPPTGVPPVRGSPVICVQAALPAGMFGAFCVHQPEPLLVSW